MFFLNYMATFKLQLVEALCTLEAHALVGAFTFSEVMKGHSEQERVPFDSPFLSEVTFVGVLLTGWKLEEEKQDLESVS